MCCVGMHGLERLRGSMCCMGMQSRISLHCMHYLMFEDIYVTQCVVGWESLNYSMCCMGMHNLESSQCVHNSMFRENLRY